MKSIRTIRDAIRAKGGRMPNARKIAAEFCETHGVPMPSEEELTDFQESLARQLRRVVDPRPSGRPEGSKNRNPAKPRFAAVDAKVAELRQHPDLLADFKGKVAEATHLARQWRRSYDVLADHYDDWAEGEHVERRQRRVSKRPDRCAIEEKIIYFLQEGRTSQEARDLFVALKARTSANKGTRQFLVTHHLQWPGINEWEMKTLLARICGKRRHRYLPSPHPGRSQSADL